MKHTGRLLLLALVPMLLPACARIQVAPIEVKPIHIVHDINIRVDRELDEFFAFERGAATRPATAPAPSPTTTTASNH